MIIKWNKKNTYLEVNQKKLKCSCVVRNEINGWRKKHEVIKSIPDGKPVYPRTFPKGRWKIYRPEKRYDDYKAPYFIPTDAYRMLPVWELDENGHYKNKINEEVKDEGYGLHFSTSGTTLGCIKIHNKIDLLYLVDVINRELNKDNNIYLEVV